MDYRLLLYKYLNHVWHWEGISYVPSEVDGNCVFTEEELKALQEIEDMNEYTEK